MSYRQKRNGSWVVEVYDPKLKRKVHVRARDHGMEPPRTERHAKALERAALNARDTPRAGGRDETCGSFAERWPDDYGGRGRGESTRVHNRERVRTFGEHEDFKDRPLRAVTREEGRDWAGEHPSTVPSLRAMFNDAIRDQLADENPFAKLGLEQTKGREDITVLTREEVELLAATAVAVHGQTSGASSPRWSPGRRSRACARGRHSPRATASLRAIPTTCASSGTRGCARRPRRSTAASAPSTCRSRHSARSWTSRAASATT